MDPVTIGMAAVSIGSAIYGGIESAKGAAQKADAQTAMYGYKAAVAQANQRVAAQNAQQAIQEGGVAGQFAGLQGAQQLGHMTTAQAASGLAVGGGSAALARAGQRAGIQTGEATTAYDAARKAYGYQVQGMNFAGEAGLAAMGGQEAQVAKGYDVASVLGGTASSVADKWMQYSKAGVFSGSGSGSSGGGPGAWLSDALGGWQGTPSGTMTG